MTRKHFNNKQQSAEKDVNTKPKNLAEIARMAGVSIAAVSVIMRQEMGIPVKMAEMRFSQETRRKVMEVVKKTGYRLNTLGQALVSGKSSLVGFLLQAESSSFMFEYTQAIEDEAAKKRYGTLIMTTHIGQKATSNPLDLMLQKQIDGLIITSNSWEFLTPDICERIIEQKVPVVYLSYLPQKPIAGSSSVRVDGRKIGRLAIQHLNELKHRHIATVIDDNWIYEGINEIVQKKQIQLERWNCNIKQKHSMEEIFHLWYNLSKRPTAIFVNSDQKAIALMNIMIRNKIRIPKDVSIIGCNNISIASESIVPLSTIHQPKYEQGAEACRLIFDIIEGEKPRNILLEPELIVRESTSHPF